MTFALVALSMVCPDSLNALGSGMAAAEAAADGDDDPALPLLPALPLPQLAGEPLRDALVVEAEEVGPRTMFQTRKGEELLSHLR